MGLGAQTGEGTELSLSWVLSTSVLAEDLKPWPSSQDRQEAFCRTAQSCHREAQFSVCLAFSTLQFVY